MLTESIFTKFPPVLGVQSVGEDATRACRPPFMLPLRPSLTVRHSKLATAESPPEDKPKRPATAVFAPEQTA